MPFETPPDEYLVELVRTEEKGQGREQKMIVATPQVTVGIDTDRSDDDAADNVGLRRKAHGARYRPLVVDPRHRLRGRSAPPRTKASGPGRTNRRALPVIASAPYGGRDTRNRKAEEGRALAPAQPGFWLDTADRVVGDALRVVRLERAIGVIYRPETERQSHYFEARLADQFDAVIHLDRTRALEPLERTSIWDRCEPPESFPTGL